MTHHPDIRWKQRFQNYQKALTQLRAAVAVRNPDILQKQGTIQCFEYTFELAWKTLQDYLSQTLEFADVMGPRPVLQQAFQSGIVTNGLVWFDMLKSRNLSNRLYDEAEAEVIYQKVSQQYLAPFDQLQAFFETQP